MLRLEKTNVPGSSETWSHDYYFSELFEPQANEDREWRFGPFVSRREVRSNEGSRWVDEEPNQADEAKITGSVLFVQFVDGSTWGNRKEGETVLVERRNSVDKLQALASLYRDKGEAAFINDLLRPSDLPVILSLQYFCQHTNNKSKVVDRLFRILATVEDHAHMMRSAPKQD